MAPIDLCLPLLKYSYADSDTTSSSIDWTHFSAVNLCVLVQGDDISNGRLTLSIVDKTTHKVLMIVTQFLTCLTLLTEAQGNNRYRTLCRNGQ